ncbi:MAG TPA: hypothetical protein VG826_17785 [Pirellulales bacterium]|nr:hypothetical protein [Pirellulales bacterium]
MSADLWAVVEFVGFVGAASLFACGVWKLDMRLLAAGALLAGLVWFGLGCTNTDEWTSHEVVTLRLRPVDATSGEMVADAVIKSVDRSQPGTWASFRLPAGRDAPPDGSAAFLAVSLVVELRVQGSLVEQYHEPAICTEVTDEVLQITAPGYRPWRGTLLQLLPKGWPIASLDNSPIVIELKPS